MNKKNAKCLQFFILKIVMETWNMVEKVTDFLSMTEFSHLCILCFFLLCTSAAVRDFWKLSKQLQLRTLQTFQGKYLVLVFSGILPFYRFQNLHEAYNSIRNFASQAPYQGCFELLVSYWARLYLSKHKRCLIMLDLFLEEIYFPLEFQWVGQKYLLAQLNIGSRKIILKCQKQKL